MASTSNGGEQRREEEQARAPLRLCSWPEDLEGNCVLSVEGTQVHVNKTLLSMHSPFFRCLFYCDFLERATDRYEVKDVDTEAFIEMLRVILPSKKPIDENNVESLLYFADRFGMDHLKTECIAFLREPTAAAKSISIVHLTQLAFRYNIHELKNRVIGRICYEEDQVSALRLRECPRLAELSREELQWFLDVIITRQHTLEENYVDMDCDCPNCVRGGVDPASRERRRNNPFNRPPPCSTRCRHQQCDDHCTQCHNRGVPGNPYYVPVVPVLVPVVPVMVPVMVVTWYYR